MASNGKWRCASCGEKVDAHFEICWNCQSPRPDYEIDLPKTSEAPFSDKDAETAPILTAAAVSQSAAPAASQQPAWRLWLEVLVVLALVQPFASILVLLLQLTRIDGHAVGEIGDYVLRMTDQIIVAMITLLAIIRSGDPWSMFGICKPNAFDLLGGVVTMAIDNAIKYVGIYLLLGVLISLFGVHYVQGMHGYSGFTFPIQDFPQFIALVALMVLVGFSEELLGRGYLIPRLEQLLHSTSSSVVVSAVIFAIFHVSAGVFSVWGAFLTGIVYGSVFAITRRLWPVAIAHSLVDLMIAVSY
jgi:membrane protease YdiL (CAAX protease family)